MNLLEVSSTEYPLHLNFAVLPNNRKAGLLSILPLTVLFCAICLAVSNKDTLTINAISVPLQDMQPLSIQAVLPEVQLKDNRGLIAPSQRLLATADSAVDQCTAPSLGYVPQLLQLNPSLLASDAPPSHTSPPRRPEHTGSVLRGRLAFSSPLDPAPPKVVMSEKPRSQEVPLPIIPTPVPAPMQGLRLLHCHSPSQNHISASKLPRLPSFRPGPGISVPMTDVPIKLLQIDSAPKKVSLRTNILL